MNRHFPKNLLIFKHHTLKHHYYINSKQKNWNNDNEIICKYIIWVVNWKFLIKGLFSGLPPSGSWQDLKDHMREAGDVCFADVYKDGTGVVEFLRYDDMKYAFKKLDDSRFRSHEVCF